MDKNFQINRTDLSSKWSAIMRLGLYSVGLSALLFVFSYMSFIAYTIWTDRSWIVEMLKEHTSSMVGLPLAAVAGFFLVALLEVTAGKIEIDAFGFKLRGASGPVILWIASFLAMVAAIKLLW